MQCSVSALQHNIICVQKTRNLIISSSFSPQSNRSFFDLFPGFCFTSTNLLHIKYKSGSCPLKQIFISKCILWLWVLVMHISVSLCTQMISCSLKLGLFLVFRCHVRMDVAPDVTAVSCFNNSSFHSLIKQKYQTFADDLLLYFVISERDWGVFYTLVMKYSLAAALLEAIFRLFTEMNGVLDVHCVKGQTAFSIII